MIYNRNKNCFKKTTVKTEHRQAQKNILNLIKESIGKESTPKISNFTANQHSQNQCKNSQIQEASPPKIAVNNFFKTEKPICESIYSSVDRHMTKIKKQLAINHTFDFTIIGSANQSKVQKAQKQYVQILQSKIKQMEVQINNQKQKIADLDVKLAQKSRMSSYRDFQVEKLIRFYHRSRNVLVLQSVELVQCKNLFANQLKQNQTRLKSMNSVMAKGEQLLEIYRRSIQMGSPRQPKEEHLQKMDSQQLKQLCKYQQKTIEFLRKQNPYNHQLNQIRLLRHQINRVCNQNQNLLNRLNKKSPQKVDKASPRTNKQNDKNYKQQLENAHRKIKNLQSEILQLKQRYTLQQQKTYKLRQEKQCLVSFLDNAKTKSDQLQKCIQKYQQQIYQLKSAYLNNKRTQQKLQLESNEIATTQQLCRQLKRYPKYFNLLMSIINEYEFKINQLQNWICSEREQKEKFMQWSTEVYHLLESAQIPQHILQKHRQQLYSVDRKVQNSKIQKLLRSICAYSIGVDDKDIRQMEYELQEYILSLKNRNQVIKQVEFQDGSSVTFSECYTEQQFD